MQQAIVDPRRPASTAAGAQLKQRRSPVAALPYTPCA
jgi:hypothetical protein